jgi:hypothetical protein
MKRAISVVLQLILMLAVFLVGSLLPVINVLPMYSVSIGPGRIFVMDGLVLMFLLYLLILAIAAARKTIRVTVVTSTLAFVLALALGLAMKFGFKSI